MSDNWLILIPTSPEYVPSKDAQELAVALFKRVAPEADEIEVELSDHPRLIHCGANLQKINCPSCRRELDIEWWDDWISQESKLGFPLKPTALPCCGAVHSLADLLYDWPQGFARFSLEAMNPNIRDLPKAVEQEFETVMRCSVRKIWLHL
jgi:hypothetical protein